MPPFMGQGMNSGCRDAENLLWKINGVLKGLYSSKILETYETERKPHVARITRAAIKMGGVINAKSKFKALIRNAALRIQGYFKGKENIFPILNGNRLGQGVHNMPKIKDVSLERYYFNEISVRLDDGRIQSTDKLLGKNFGIILNDFDGNKKISDEYLEFLNKHNFKILNISGSYENSNYENYIACEDTHTDMKIYCDKYECNAIILRPDKYVFDIFNLEAASLDEIVATTIKSLEKTRLFN
jgi:3-(3-hydroxy-phenyl)propionate hydroxylase